jgi:glycosyltransferase involved in cell wall biosynthesis
LRAAVYNRFLQSMGGGERHSGMLAQVLAEDGHEVDLIAHDDVGKDILADHLGLKLGKVNLRIVPDEGEERLARISAEYDLFVNATYMSRLAPRARHNLYLCFFPTPVDHDMGQLRRQAIRLLSRWARSPEGGFQRGAFHQYGAGWFPPEGGRRRSYTWTSGDAWLSLAAGAPTSLVFDLGRPGAAESATLTVTDEAGTRIAELEADAARFTRVRIPIGARTSDTRLRLVSDTFVPGPGDSRSLGVAVSRLRLDGTSSSPRERLAERFPWLLRDPRDLTWLESYERVLANSEYTRGWIRRYWDVDADLLFPPIRVHELHPGTKRRSIISVGRFISRGQGHQKKQLEMVQAFGALVRKGGLDGWKLHVVGGVEPANRPYFEQVKAAAEGLPVELHPNAPRTLVEQLFATSSVFWSATGLGEDERTAPWTFEHFGMTTVEAMAAGCVPVVIDKAGQREIVRDGQDGYRWTNLDQLEARTLELAADEELRAKLGAAAVERAADFSDDAFADRWREIAARLGLEGGRPS